MGNLSVAMIGSFHRALEDMRGAMAVFAENGIEVVNPLSVEPFDPGVDFVRFPTDEADSDVEVELGVLLRILGATAVYVVRPDDAGRTTLWEWGFIEGRKRPAYF